MCHVRSDNITWIEVHHGILFDRRLSLQKDCFSQIIVIGRNCSLESFETPEVETMAFRSLNRRPLSYACISRQLTLYCSIECQMRILVRYREYQSLFGKKTCAQQKAKFSSTAEDLQVWTSPKVCTIGRFKRLLISFLNVLAKTLSSFWITWS